MKNHALTIVLRRLLYFALFIFLTIVNFYVLAITAAFLFPGISDTAFAYIYALIFPPAISAVEVLLGRKHSRKKHSSTSVSVQTSPVIWDVQAEPVDLIDAKSISPALPLASATNIQREYAKYGGPEAELLNIDLMDGHDFEYWCADLLLKVGFDSADVTQVSGDDGVDIIATKEGIRYAIQCKRYSSDLGNKPVQEVYTGKSVYNCHVCAVMTNRYFTTGGKRAAEATGTLLWDRDWIKAHL